MLRNLVVAAALLSSTVAHAELVTNKQARTMPPPETLTVERVLDKITTSYMPGLRRCYNKGLVHDPALAGKVTVTFTVSPYGRVRGEATGIAPKVDTCLTAALATWRFPTARKEATFRISLLLSR